jgi:hypothetical protein
MEDNLDLQMSATDLKITSEMKQMLITAGKWSRFLAIVMYILSGLIFIGAISMLMIGMRFGVGSQLMIMSLVYIGMGTLYIFFGLYMFRFGKNAISGMERNRQGDFAYSIESLRNFFRLSGIMTIVAVALYLIIIVVGFGAAAML